MTKGLGELLLSDTELQQTRKEIHEFTGEWIGYNYDEYNGVADYKIQLKNKLERLRQQKRGKQE